MSSGVHSELRPLARLQELFIGTNVDTTVSTIQSLKVIHQVSERNGSNDEALSRPVSHSLGGVPQIVRLVPCQAELLDQAIPCKRTVIQRVCVFAVGLPSEV